MISGGGTVLNCRVALGNFRWSGELVMTGPRCLTLESRATINPKFLVSTFWKVACSMRESDYEATIESPEYYFGMILLCDNGDEPAENAGGGDRTHTILRSLDFESSASASSATPARRESSYKREAGAQAPVDELARSVPVRSFRKRNSTIEHRVAAQKFPAK
jgi:hypothetical protein